MDLHVRAATLTGYFEVAQALHFSPRDLLREAGINPTVLATPEQLVPAKAMVWLLEESARRTGKINFGLRMADERKASGLGVVGMLLPHRRTLRDAIETLIEYRQLLNEMLVTDITDNGNVVLVRQEVLPVIGRYSRQATELAMGVLVNACRMLLGARWHPMSVHFTHSSPSDLMLHNRVFGCELEFDSELNGFTCSSSDLDGLNPLADPFMVEQLEQSIQARLHVKPDSTTLAVQQAIVLLLPVGRASIDQVADHLHMSVRTLQRRLDDEAMSFSDIVDTLRRDLAVRYLMNKRYSVEHVAILLGYTSQSAFGRWFKREYGRPPKQWRTDACEIVAQTPPHRT
ncbi:AraC family transcriptional regulator [Pandoraea terrae]|uniref:AraC family transcriptional regulator n=1 Tax=Pandoraea terrae TaxID=1537710 RepID=A0A5E4WJ24_9BURK|nr:AraC family transcriptional regulator [Pandoraea terrae]VVE23066.1 AraC family transcriptional regulator [Pandoraea terrae]